MRDHLPPPLLQDQIPGHSPAWKEARGGAAPLLAPLAELLGTRADALAKHVVSQLHSALGEMCAAAAAAVSDGEQVLLRAGLCLRMASSGTSALASLLKRSLQPHGLGGAALGLGMVYSQAPAAGAIHEASLESTRDTGNIMTIVGAIATAVGVGLLTSELVDAIMLEDTRVATDVVIKPIQGPQAACADGPAKNHTIMIGTLPSGEQMTQRVTVVTDDCGRATINLKDPQFDTFPYGDPFAVIRCDHCTGWNLTLLPDSAAELAIHRQDHAALSGWAETYGAQSDPVLSKQVKEAKMRRDVIALGDAITFSTGSAKLRRDASKHLDQAAEFLLKRRNLQLRIEGHTDSTGNESKNRELSRRRAESVKRYLVQRGVPPDRLITVGMASSHPVKSNKSEAGRKANRRYQFQLLED